MTAEKGASGKAERVVPLFEEGAPSAKALDGSFRFGYEIRIGLALALGAAASTLSVYALLAVDLADYTRSVSTIRSVRSMVLGVSLLSGLIQLTVGGLLVSALALIASNKIVGPTVRLVRLLRGMANGQLPDPVSFRRCDQTGRLAAYFNRVGERLGDRHADVVDQLTGLRSSYGELKRTLEEPQTSEERSRASREVRQRADALAGRLHCLAANAEADSIR